MRFRGWMFWYPNLSSIHLVCSTTIVVRKSSSKKTKPSRWDAVSWMDVLLSKCLSGQLVCSTTIVVRKSSSRKPDLSDGMRFRRWMFYYPNVPSGHLVCRIITLGRERSGRNVLWMRCRVSVFCSIWCVIRLSANFLLRYKTFLMERNIASWCCYKPGVPMDAVSCMRCRYHYVPSRSFVCSTTIVVRKKFEQESQTFPMGCGFVDGCSDIQISHRYISSVAQR